MLKAEEIYRITMGFKNYILIQDSANVQDQSFSVFHLKFQFPVWMAKLKKKTKPKKQKTRTETKSTNQPKTTEQPPKPKGTTNTVPPQINNRRKTSPG